MIFCVAVALLQPSPSRSLQHSWEIPLQTEGDGGCGARNLSLDTWPQATTIICTLSCILDSKVGKRRQDTGRASLLCLLSPVSCAYPLIVRNPYAATPRSPDLRQYRMVGRPSARCHPAHYGRTL